MRILAYLRRHHVGLLALFVALGGTTAYATHAPNLTTSEDIVDGQVKNPDVQPNAITATRLAAESVETSEIKTGNVFNADIAANAITDSRLAADSVGASEVKPNSLTGAEVDESTLQVPRGRGTFTGRGQAVTAAHSIFLPLDFSSPQTSADLIFDCPSDPSANNGAVSFRNLRPLAVEVFVDNGTTTDHVSLPSAPAGGVATSPYPTTITDHVTVQARWTDDRIVTSDLFVKNRPTDCHVQVQNHVSYDTLAPAG